MAHIQKCMYKQLQSISSAGTEHSADTTPTRLSSESSTSTSDDVFTENIRLLDTEATKESANLIPEQRRVTFGKECTDKIKSCTVDEIPENSKDQEQKHRIAGFQNSLPQMKVIDENTAQTSRDSKISDERNCSKHNLSSAPGKPETPDQACGCTCGTHFGKQNVKDGHAKLDCSEHNGQSSAKSGATEECALRNNVCTCQRRKYADSVNGNNLHADASVNCNTASAYFRERDKMINDFQLQDISDLRSIRKMLENEYKDVSSLKKKYASIQKLFMFLAVVSIILIVCVVAILPVIIITVRMGQPSDDKIEQMVKDALQSSKIRDDIIRETYCVRCEDVPDKLSAIFEKGTYTGECCLKSIMTVTDQLMKHFDQGYEVLDNKIKDLSLLRIQLNYTGSPNVSQIPLGIHSQVAKNNEKIGELLTRRRSAIHLKSQGANSLQWMAVTAEGRITAPQQGKYIQIDKGGTYFIYSTLRFKRGDCQRGRSFGYEIKITNSFSVASIRRECVNGTSSMEQDLSVQVLHTLGEGSELYIELDSTSQNLMHDSSVHTFGVFEI